MNITEAYKNVCEGDSPFRTHELINGLERQGLNYPDNAFRFLLNKKYHYAASKNIQQTLLRSGRRPLMQSMIRYCAGDQSEKIFPLPPGWLSFLQNEGVVVDYKGSKKEFFKQQCKAWFRSIMAFKSKILCGVKSYEVSQQSYQMAPQLPANAYDSNADYNFVNWLRRNDEWNGKERLFVTSSQSQQPSNNDNINVVDYVLPRLILPALILFSIKMIWLFSIGFCKWAMGAWWVPFLMAELVHFEYFKHVKRPARRYLFNNSSFAIRPLWTYAAQDEGIDVILYFYSSNIRAFYPNQKKDEGVLPSYLSMSWPHYWVLDEAQKQYFKETCDIDSSIDVKGVIDFTDNDVQCIRANSKPTIAMFDIPIYNRDYISNLGLIAPYYTLDTMRQFIKDTIDLAEELNFQILWKIKRDIDTNPNITDYASILNDYKNKPWVTFVNPEMSARKIIKTADLSLSIPFTSTALSGVEEGKLAFFYDPTNSLQSIQIFFPSVPMLHGKNDLRNYLKKYMEQQSLSA
jgi:polysaccharide biosynthesis PFTS motif protein